MGIDTWYAVGSHFDERTIVSLAKAMVSRGLRAAGYRYLWIDGGWWNGRRDSSQRISVSHQQWPHGMRWLAAYIHSKGLLAGIYTDAGRAGCAAHHAGSYGHYQADVNTFATWGFDAVKVDFCGGNVMHLDPRIAFPRFANALLNSSPKRPMLLNICNPVSPGAFGPGDPPWVKSAYATYLFGPKTANSWRTGNNVGAPGDVRFGAVLRSIDHDAAHPGAAMPGHWNDPDYIVPDAGMTASEARAQFTMWAILAAPLVLGDDIRSMPARTRALVTSAEAIAIDQDVLGSQGRRIARAGGGEVWVRQLSGGDRAVAFLNRGRSAMSIRSTAALIGLPGAPSYSVRDVWAGRTSATTGSVAAVVPGHGAVLLRVSAS
jgi:alpha-galactosidase